MSVRFIQAGLLIAALATASAWAKARLRITSPADGAVVNPGQTITVTVSAEAAYTQVMIIGENPIGLNQLLTAPPYQASLVVPKDITPRLYSLAAAGVPANGDTEFAQPIYIDVERSDRPVSLKLQPSHMSLKVGEQTGLVVTGTYADGSTVDLTKSTQTKFVSRAPGILTVTADGLVTAVAPGSTEIAVDKDFVVKVSVRK